MRQIALRGALVGVAILAVARSSRPADLEFKDELLDVLVDKVPGILESFDAESGRFGSGVWICRDQHPMYPLAVAYATEGEGNRYYRDAELLGVIAKSADPLIEEMDEQGRWIFKKKDGSTWGMIWMPWTYSRWIRTFALVRDDLAPEVRKKWTDALTLGYTGISRRSLGHVHNIPTHHAMGLYIAGKTLDRPEWCEQAAEFMNRVIGTQSEGGYWSEGGGPVVLYDFVYVDALGTYYAASGDERVLPGLEKAAAFHRHFTYPGGQNVETIDQRNPYHDTIAAGNVGFTLSAVGRAFLSNQWSQLGMENLDPDLIASLLLYGEEGPVEEVPPGGAKQVFVLTEGGIDRAATVRHGPWFVCLSAYTTPIVKSRWIQDRQSFVSVYHDRTGLILGGGNTKLQPAWSTFTVGDAKLLSHTPGDESPDFLPKGELYHVPSAAKLVLEPEPGLDLTYGAETCRLRVTVRDDRSLVYRIEATAESELPVAAHLTLLPHLGEALKTGGGEEVTIGSEPLALSAEQVGGSISYAGFRLRLPPCATLHWPALPHNPYRKDGRASPSEGRIEIRIPFDQERRDYRITLEIVRS
jgi:hypothetical protein